MLTADMQVDLMSQDSVELMIRLLQRSEPRVWTRDAALHRDLPLSAIAW